MSLEKTKIALISQLVREKIDHWLQKYPPERKQSCVLPALRFVQEQNGGWLTVDLMDAVADYLGLPKIAVYEVVSFYNMYETKPVGRHKVAICNSLPCMLCKSQTLIEHVEKRLGIKIGETTSDGRYTLKEAECLAACAGAPMMQIDNREYYEHLTLEKIDAIFDAIDREDQHHVK